VLSAAAICLFARDLGAVRLASQYPLSIDDPMSLSTAVIGVALSTATVLQRPERGGRTAARQQRERWRSRPSLAPDLDRGADRDRVAHAARRRIGLFDAAVATALGVVAGIIILSSCWSVVAGVVDRLQAVRHGNEAQIRQMVHDIARHSADLHRTNSRARVVLVLGIARPARSDPAHRRVCRAAEQSRRRAARCQGPEVPGHHHRFCAECRGSDRRAPGALADRSAPALHVKDVDLGELVRDSWNKPGDGTAGPRHPVPRPAHCPRSKAIRR